MPGTNRRDRGPAGERSNALLSSATSDQPAERPIEIGTQIARGPTGRIGPRPDDNTGTGRQSAKSVGHQMAQLPGHPMTAHGRPDLFAHNESCPRRGISVTQEMNHQRRPPGPCATAHDLIEIHPAAQPSRLGQHDGKPSQADSAERPLVRRRAMIARPARVRMRSRKPWVFARRRLFG
jgi:hypothetical protein